MNNTIQLFFSKHPNCIGKECEIIALYQQEYSILELSKKYNVTQTTIKKFLIHNGIKIRSKQEARNITRYNKQFSNTRKKIKDQQTINLIIDEYNSGIGAPELGEKYNVHYNTIRLLLKRNGVKLRSCKESQSHIKIKQRIQRLCFKKHGVYNVMQLPEIFERSQQGSFKFKTTTINGKIINNLQGYEAQGIIYILLKYADLNINDIECGRSTNIPTINYELNGSRTYFPDIYIPKYNLIIDIKSDYTYNVDLEKNIVKQQATHKLGFKHKFIVIDKSGNLIQEI